MIRKFLACFIAVEVSLMFLANPAIGAPDGGSTDISGSTNERDSLYIAAHGDGASNGEKRPAGKPTKKVTLQPTCESFVKGSTSKADIVCEVHECPDGQRQYLRTTEDISNGFKEFETICGQPDRSPGTLAIDEFYKSTVTVPTPSLAPKNTTLVGFPNIYWTDVKEYEENTGITLANVRLKFIPVKYIWDFGDGENETTTDPGKPFDPKLTTTLTDVEKNYTNFHSYDTTGSYDTTLTVVFKGQYSVGGGNWIDIAGSIQNTSPPHTLIAYEARGELVTPGEN